MLLWKWNMQLGSPGDGSPEKTVIWLQIRATLETLEVFLFYFILFIYFFYSAL